MAISAAVAIGALKAVGEPTRLRLLHILSFGELTVTEITQVLGQSQPRVSRHLKLLLDAGLIERLPEGAWTFYRLRESDLPVRQPGFVRSLIRDLDNGDAVLAGDIERLEGVKAARERAAHAYFEDHAAEWGTIRSQHQPVGAVETAMRQLLEPQPIGLLVDLGTGTGRILEALQGLYTDAIGFDVNHSMLGVARVNLDRAGIRNAHVRYGNLFALPDIGRPDAVVLHQVLHYLNDPAAAIRAAAGYVAGGGCVLVVDYLPHAVETLRTAHAHRHLGFTDSEIRRWMNDAGLEVVATDEVSASAEPLAAVPPTVSLWLARPSEATVVPEASHSIER